MDKSRCVPAVCRLFPIVAAFAIAMTAIANDTTIFIRNVTVVDVERGELREGRDVLVRGERIERIERAGTIDVPADAQIIAGRELYLMPGLFDAHVHITAGQGAFEPLLIAHGVTAARDTGAPTEAIISLRESAASGETLSPELFITGAIIDGDPPIWPFSEACDTPEQARAAVQRLARAGVDQIKVYSMLKADVYHAAVEEAARHDLPVTGHVPISVTLQEAIEAGQNCIEHLDGFPPLFERILAEGGHEPQRAGIAAIYRGWMRFDEIDPDAIRQAVIALAEANLMQCPTLAVWAGTTRVVDEGRSDQRLKYIPPTLRAFWDGRWNERFAHIVQRAMPAKKKLLAMMYEHDVPLMIGTDLGNPHVFPGWSVHEEMRLFQDAGIAPADVLRMATIIPARFCGAGDRLGSIKPGKTASMILLRNNPLEDIANASTIEAVFLRGRYFDRDALDELFEKAEEAAQLDPTIDEEEVPLQLPGEVVHRGRFTMKFQEWDAGIERFLVTRAADGWHAAAHTMPAGGWGEPSVSTLHLDARGRFVRATWTQLVDPPVRAEYTIDNGRLHARAQRGDDEPQTHSVPVSETDIIAPPVYVADMLQVPRLDLAPGEKREMTVINFGFMSWQPMPARATIERLDDQTITIEDDDEARELTAHAYRYVIKTEMTGEMDSELLIDETGVLRQSTTRMQMGTVRAQFIEEASN